MKTQKRRTNKNYKQHSNNKRQKKKKESMKTQHHTKHGKEALLIFQAHSNQPNNRKTTIYI